MNTQPTAATANAQYLALAWLVAHTGVPDERITTHRAIDQSGSRIDPTQLRQPAALDGLT